MDFEEEATIHNLETIDDPRNEELPQYVIVFWHPLVAYSCIITWRLYMIMRVYLFVTSGNFHLLQLGFLFAEWSFAVLSEDSQRLTISTGNAANSKPRRPLLRARGSNLPNVDVLVTCCGEDVEIIINTVKAACMFEYPVQKFRVVLLDDGDSTRLRTAIAELARDHTNVRYVARKKQACYSFSKAENLNHALLNVQNINWPAPEFVAVFDADFIPEPHFLRATLPHVLRNSKVAIVSTLQHFYNLPAKDPLFQALDYGTSILEPMQDRRGLAVCSGTGFLFRREAILQVGGFPACSFNEDHLLTALLRGSSWQIVLAQEPLQFGLVPDSIEGHIGQRQRWSLGVVQMVNIWWADEVKMNAKHRWQVGKEGFMFAVHLVRCAFAMAIVPVSLLSDQQLVSYSARWELKTVLILAWIYHANCWLHEYIIAISSNFLCSVFPHLNQIWLTIPQIQNLVCYYTFTLLGYGSAVMPRPTLSSETSWAEHSKSAQTESKSRRPILFSFNRLRGLLFSSGLLIHVLLFILVLLSNLLSLRSNCTFLFFCPAALQKSLFPSALWLSYVVVTQCYVPLSHIVAKTAWPEWGAMLERNGPNGAWYPSQIAKERALRRRKRRVGAGGHFFVVLGIYLWVALEIWRL